MRPRLPGSPEADVSLLCRLGRHRPRGIPRWNDGYYFATCERCGADLVRTAFQRWHVPDGYRIVWSERPPASRPEVALVAEDKGPPVPGGAPEGRAGPVHGPGAPAAAALPEPVHDPLPGPPASSPAAEAPAEVPSPPAKAAGPDERPPADTPVPDSGSSNGRLPIQEVLARLHAEDAANRTPESAPAPAPAPAPAEVPAPRRRPAWDFMEDESFKDRTATGPEPAPGAPALPAAAAGSPPRAHSEEGGAVASIPPGRSGEGARRIRSAVSNFWSGPDEPRPILVVALASAVAVAVALALALPSTTSPSVDPLAASRPGGGGADGAGEAPDPFATDASFAPGAEADSAARRRQPESAGAGSPKDRAYVAASLLSCRAAPVRQSRRVRNLARGQEVRVIAIEGDWASLAYRGGQCWAQARYISPVPPL